MHADAEGMLNFEHFDMIVHEVTKEMGEEYPGQDEVRKYFGMADRNGDGMLGYDEFADLYNSLNEDDGHRNNVPNADEVFGRYANRQGMLNFETFDMLVQEMTKEMGEEYP